MIMEISLIMKQEEQENSCFIKEILKITNKLKEGGLTVVPTKMYFSGSKAKLEIALAKGKKLYDKRNDLKEKAAKRDIEKSLKNYY